MKVVLDTNVLISSVIAYGPPKDVLDLIIQKHELMISRYILDELKEKLMIKLKFTKADTNKIIHFFENFLYEGEVKQKPQTYFSDKKDLPILSFIEVTKPDYFVTGDKKLLKIGAVGDCHFLSPHEGLKVL